MRRALLIILLVVLGLLSTSVWRLVSNHKIAKPASQESEIQAVDNGLSPSLSDSELDTFDQEDFQLQQVLAAKVINDINQGISTDSFNTGNARYDGEWALGSYQMAALGLGQFIQAYPEFRDEYLPVIQRCAERITSEEINAFGTAAWGEEGINSLSSENGHAYLGYVNLALSMLRLHEKDNNFAEINDQLTETFVRRLKSSNQSIFETYPNETYPADLAAVIASIGLYEQATGLNYEDFLAGLIFQFQQNFVDPQTGLVFQAVDASSGNPVDAPRASGTALSAYFMSFVSSELSKTLFLNVAKNQKVQVSGFTGIREYPEGQTGEGDIDSGTLVSGVSPSATAFTIGGARLFGERELSQELYKTINFFGKSPMGEMNGISLLESPLGNAILLAMLTANHIEN
ncbi:MAG: hypothetical protein F6K00_21975 [Leptolyngbya sp. SIOISBB]|nr:hypothetical protein [Leptolyngbya sp. SIOISBB]